MDKWSMIFQLTMQTGYSEEYLLRLAEEDPKQLEKIWRERVEQ